MSDKPDPKVSADDLIHMRTLAAQRDAALAEVARLRVALDGAVGVLREGEWCIFNANDRQIICPICYGMRGYGDHAPDCRLAKALGGAQ